MKTRQSVFDHPGNQYDYYSDVLMLDGNLPMVPDFGFHEKTPVEAKTDKVITALAKDIDETNTLTKAAGVVAIASQVVGGARYPDIAVARLVASNHPWYETGGIVAAGYTSTAFLSMVAINRVTNYAHNVTRELGLRSAKAAAASSLLPGLEDKPEPANKLEAFNQRIITGALRGFTGVLSTAGYAVALGTKMLTKKERLSAQANTALDIGIMGGGIAALGSAAMHGLRQDWPAAANAIDTVVQHPPLEVAGIAGIVVSGAAVNKVKQVRQTRSDRRAAEAALASEPILHVIPPLQLEPTSAA
jgi:hypothetical protein